MRKLALLTLVLVVCAHAEERLGTIVFPNSGKAEAQAAFLRGVALLHNFAYPQAAKAFIEAQTIDPHFALAYWGEAMTYNHPLWNQYDGAAGRRVLQKLDPLKSSLDPRERGYAEAVDALYSSSEKAARNSAYEAAMERLARAYPNDTEAQAFWALSILGSREWHQLDERRSIRAAAILEELFPKHLDHPGVLHYLIHAYDDPVHAPLGLRAARRYATVASGAPHALHMPSHIFLQLGMWDDAARSNEAAYALSKEWGEPDLHSLSWLEYVYLQQHRPADAKRLIDEVKGDDAHARRTRESLKVRYASETGEWTAYEFMSPVGRAMRAIAEKRFDEAQRTIDQIDPKGDREYETLPAERDELRALLSAARGQMADAFRAADAAIKSEETLGVPSGPPETFKPAHELYGELLLQAGKPDEALQQFQMSLLRTPNRALSVAGMERARTASSKLTSK